MAKPDITVRELRRRWKPHKQRLQRAHAEHPTNIRFHRACSWLQRAEQADDDDDFELTLLGQWIALNSLYGQWGEADREPLPDARSCRDFLDKILELDENKQVAGVLVDNKPLVIAIFEDPYLSRFFWEAPGEVRAKKSRKVKFDARNWYLEGRWKPICDSLVERIYLLRCQLVHGAATYNSSLNRTSLRQCTTMLGHLLPAILSVWVDHGAHQDWGCMCYPPNPLSDPAVH